MSADQAYTPSASGSSFSDQLRAHGHAGIVRGPVTTLQVNVGLRCNLACHHCHVESGPNRSEKLSMTDCERILELLKASPQVDTLDLTGGAPELHEAFRFLVAGARDLGRRVIDRCNLTVFYEPGQADTPSFLAQHQVEVIASLPCYSLENVERQRGRGVFDKSIHALQQLNALGYGDPSTALRLSLVYNPVGPYLPPAQAELEARYRAELDAAFGIRFDRLLTITNMPIKRFAHDLKREGQLESYQALLTDHFNPGTVAGLMCRSLVSVDHAGRLFDCDFNQALGLDMPESLGDIHSVASLSIFEGREVSTGSHCFGCTAGSGSSCGGALT
jgi:radical SAM/Cys-rich protein